MTSSQQTKTIYSSLHLLHSYSEIAYRKVIKKKHCRNEDIGALISINKSRLCIYNVFWFVSHELVLFFFPARHDLSATNCLTGPGQVWRAQPTSHSTIGFTLNDNDFARSEYGAIELASKVQALARFVRKRAHSAIKLWNVFPIIVARFPHTQHIVDDGIDHEAMTKYIDDLEETGFFCV
jgi:hypothetical protein